jgi:nitrate reductase (cytochrome), electron transfer subunit
VKVSPDGEGSGHGQWLVLAAVAVAVAGVGSVVEIFHGTGTDVSLARAWGISSKVTVTPPAAVAVAYGELSTTSRGPNRDWQAHLDTLKSPQRPPEPRGGHQERREESLAARTLRRAYDGAPPVVPHPVDERSSASCVACHAEGLLIDERRAPPMPHPPYQSCTQCHVRSENLRLPAGLEVDNAFWAKTIQSGGGRRARTGTPPPMPHATWMRETCASCHGVLGPAGLRTTHPGRADCTRCHASVATLETVGGEGLVR